MTSTNPLGTTRVIVGVDTHRDEHVAVAIDCLGARLGQHRLPTAPGGYEGLHCWASGLGKVVAFGIHTVFVTQYLPHSIGVFFKFVQQGEGCLHRYVCVT